MHSTNAIFYLMDLKTPGANEDVLTKGPALTPSGNARIYAQFYGFS